MISLMGKCMSCVKNRRESGKSLTLAILGLDNAGKTVTTKGLQGAGLEDVAPTIGFSNAKFKFKKFNITLFDLGGGKKIRDIWKNYYGEVYGLVYVIDSSEPDRIAECKFILEQVLSHAQVAGKPILVLANKQDKDGAMDEIDICEQLNLEETVNMNKCPCRVETCSAISGQGKKLDKSIQQGMQWLVDTISNNFAKLHERVEKDMAEQKEKNEKEKLRKKMEREARWKKEEQDRGSAGESEGEDRGDPFKRVDIEELRQKELKEKEAKKKKKKKGRQLSDDEEDTENRSPFRSSRLAKRFSGTDEEDGIPRALRSSGMPLTRNHRSLSDEGLYSRDSDMLVTQSNLKLSMDSSRNFRQYTPRDNHRPSSPGRFKSKKTLKSRFKQDSDHDSDDGPTWKRGISNLHDVSELTPAEPNDDSGNNTDEDKYRNFNGKYSHSSMSKPYLKKARSPSPPPVSPNYHKSLSPRHGSPRMSPKHNFSEQKYANDSDEETFSRFGRKSHVRDVGQLNSNSEDDLYDTKRRYKKSTYGKDSDEEDEDESRYKRKEVESHHSGHLSGRKKYQSYQDEEEEDNDREFSRSLRPALAPLPPLGLEPLSGSDEGEKKKKKKKKRFRRNKTGPSPDEDDSVEMNDHGSLSLDRDPLPAPRGWGTPPGQRSLIGVKASRSPRLEPLDETESYHTKWNLADDLPDLGHRRHRPNSYDEDILT